MSLDALEVNVDAVVLATLTYAKSTRSLGVGDGNRTSSRTAAVVAETINHNRDHELADC